MSILKIQYTSFDICGFVSVSIRYPVERNLKIFVFRLICLVGTRIMVYCCYPGCRNKCYKTYRFYRFPRDVQRRRLWAALINRSGWEPTETSRLCEVHFEDSAFESHRADGLKKLKPNAVPTIHGVSNPGKRKRRKRKVKERIEFTFGENDNESFVLAEKVPAESEKSDTIQISEVYCNESDVTKKVPERRKKLKTIHITEIVSNGLSLPISRSDEPTESMKLYNPFSNAGKQAVKIKTSKPKEGHLVRKGNQGIKMERMRSNAMDCTVNQSSGTSIEVVDKFQTINKSDTPAPTGQNIPLECYVCSKAILPGHGVNLSIPADATHVLLVQRLEIIADVEGLLSLQEMVCSRCASLLNHVDRTEAELDLLKGAISACTRGRNVLQKLKESPEYAFNMQLLDRFGTLKDGNYNVLSLDELFLIQEESQEMAGMELKDMSEEEHSQLEEVEEESLLDNCRNSVADDTHLESDFDSCSSSVIDEPEERPMISCSQLNLEPALDESNSTNIIETQDVPAISTNPRPSFSEKSLNLTTSSHVIQSSNSHTCKICNFKTPHDSVMIWHLRMHMKSGRWCDFCNVPIPVQESQFHSMRKKLESGRAKRKPIPRSVPKPILPAPPQDSSYSIQAISVPLIPMEGNAAPSPVVVISKEPDCLQETVSIPTAIVEVPKDFDSMEKVAEERVIIERDTACIVKDKPIACEGRDIGKISVPLNEMASVDCLGTVTESGSRILVTANSDETLREEFSVSVSECVNLVPGAVVQGFSSVPDQQSDVNNGCVPSNVSGFVEAAAQPNKTVTLNDEEVYFQGGINQSFLVTLSSQQEGANILPGICSIPSEEGVIAIESVAQEGNLVNKEISFRSDGLGESVLAIAYENSVAALMCQSDDSEVILSYQQ